MPLHLVFHPDDHPTQLKKVGNWVITFPPELESIQALHLIIRSVIPQQMNKQMQLLNLEICQSTLYNHWKVLSMNYFNGEKTVELFPNKESQIAVKMLQDLIQEFEKYDVKLRLE